MRAKGGVDGGCLMVVQDAAVLLWSFSDVCMLYFFLGGEGAGGTD